MEFAGSFRGMSGNLLAERKTAANLLAQMHTHVFPRAYLIILILVGAEVTRLKLKRPAFGQNEPPYVGSYDFSDTRYGVRSVF